MITGHCTSDWHDKCTQPARCTCTCHGERPGPDIAPRRPIERAPGEYRCTACTSDFRTQADLDHHRQTIHEPPKENLPMTDATTPTLCECGCGEPCPPYRGVGVRPRFVNSTHRQRARYARLRAVHGEAPPRIEARCA